MKRYLLLLLFFATLQYSYAQPAQLKFDHFTQKTGLPDQQIQFIGQDDQGYIWIGTLLGLVRYDGYKLKVYELEGKKTDEFMRSMITDKYHNLWFSTSGAFGTVGGGLFRYNRKEDSFARFSNPRGDVVRRNGQILLEFADSRGNLWGYSSSSFSGRNQVIKFDIKTKTYTYLGNKQSFKPESKTFLWIFKSSLPEENVWMGNETGLYRFDYKDNAFHPFFISKDTVKEKSVKRIFQVPSEPGILWLNVFDHKSEKFLIERLNTRDKTFEDYSHDNSAGLIASNDTINDLYEDSRRRLWFASQNGLMLFNRQSRTFTAFIPADANKDTWKNQVYRITEAKDGLIWLVCANGLLRFDPQTHLFQRFLADPKDPAGLSSNYLRELFFDSSGLLWTADQSYGAENVDVISSAFNTYPFNVRDGSFYQVGFTNNITPGADGYCLFSNDRGIFKWKPGSSKPEQIYKIKNTDIGLDAICVGKDGKVYFNNKHGLGLYDPVSRSLENYSSKPNDTTTISDNVINRILQDHTGLVWIGTIYHGICTFNPATKKFKRYPFNVSGDPLQSGGKLDGNTVDCIYEDSKGTVWVGMHLGGLNRFDRKTGKFKSFYIDGKINVYTITHLLEDHEGHLWVGTYALGLFEFDCNTGHYIGRLNEENGLLFNTVTGITLDSKGYLWVGSVRGLTRVDPKNKAVKTFPANTILPGRYFLSDYNLTQVNDQMVMVLTDGIAVFNPRDLDGNPYPPVVHIEKVSYSNPASATDSVTAKLAYGAGPLELPYNQNRVTFNYVALHYANPLRNKYAYRLNGYDKHWVQAGTQRSATYTNLIPGTYTFQVIAANSDGVWNKKGDSFTIIINPPWWQTWWAWALWIVLFISAVYAFIAYRSRKLLHDKKVLEHKVHVRTEEVMQQKEEIETQRDNLEKAFGELKATQTQLIQSEKMASLGELTAGIAHEIQNPLNFVNNFSEVNTELIGEMEQEIEKGDLTEIKAIALNIKENEKKISLHGKRADSIVKGMLQHSQSGSGVKEPTNISSLADEYMRLSYHGLRSKDKSFNAEMVAHFDKNLPAVNVIPQDIGRVLLNLFNNAFYAVNQKQKTVAKHSFGAGEGYKAEVSVTTSLENGQVVIKVKDNGVGIPNAIKEKIMQPFFTTKPTGEGTGLGLSLTYDMVVKGHGGSIEVNTLPGQYTEFKVTLPLNQ